MDVAMETVVEEAMDTAMEAVVVMEVMVEGVSVDTMVVVGGGGYSSGGDGGGYSGSGYGGGSDGTAVEAVVVMEAVVGSTRLPSTYLMSTRLPSTHLSSTHLPSMHCFCPQQKSIYLQNHILILYISPNTSQPSALKKQNNQNHENFTP
ncbi:hypothetical protein IGI04_035635 [Brassica rapa subsp. trilocularis]|uniref:Uncharacterized protein n=1 Tax=Brassica rapa subsp. trilocularis TaxID=1813537 RepID=A0ABQ7LC63_BRACM|nr:hypothetical protein IGI04_035635 [Brassica rapa subsp. trilocularis]